VLRCLGHPWSAACCVPCCRRIWRHPGDPEDDEPDDEEPGS
jgi:hypothetical protein